MMNGAKKVAAALLKIGMQSHPHDSRLAYITPNQERELEAQDGHPGTRDPITGIEHHDDSSSSGDGSSGGSTSDSDNGYGGTSGDGDGSAAGSEQAAIDAIAAAFEAAKNGPEYNETTGDLGTSGRGGNTGGVTSTATGALSGTPGGDKGQGLGEDIDSIVSDYESNRDAWNDAHNPGAAGSWDWGKAMQGFSKGAQVGSKAGMPAAVVAGLLNGAYQGYTRGDPGWNSPNSDVSDPGEPGGSSDSTSSPESLNGGSIYGAYAPPTKGSGLLDGLNFVKPTYGAYVPPSQSSTPIAARSAVYSGWQTPGQTSATPLDAIGGQPYDAVDFLDRRKKEAAIQQALMAMQPSKHSSNMPSIDDYLAGKY